MNATLEAATVSAPTTTPAHLRAELDRPFTLSADAVTHYRRDGFIRLKNVFSAELLAHYAIDIEAEVARCAANLPPLADRSTYGKSFQQVCNIWPNHSTVREFVFGKRLAKIAAELMQCEGVRLYHDQALFKEPGGGHTPWHSDQTGWPMATNHCVTAWVPLQATPKDMGPLAFAVGSHRMHGKGRDLSIGDESESRLGKTLKDIPKIDHGFDLGEVSFHGGWIFHRAQANSTAHMRKVMTVIYMDADMRMSAPVSINQQHDARSWMPGIVPGEVAASPINPILYP